VICVRILYKSLKNKSWYYYCNFSLQCSVYLFFCTLHWYWMPSFFLSTVVFLLCNVHQLLLVVGPIIRLSVCLSVWCLSSHAHRGRGWAIEASWPSSFRGGCVKRFAVYYFLTPKRPLWQNRVYRYASSICEKTVPAIDTTLSAPPPIVIGAPCPLPVYNIV